MNPEVANTPNTSYHETRMIDDLIEIGEGRETRASTPNVPKVYPKVTSKTNLMYTYQIPFVILPNGQLKAAGDPMVAGIGEAGIRVDDCVGTKPVSMMSSFEFLGRKMDMSIDEIDPGILLSALDLTHNGRMTVHDIALVTPKITSFELEPFTACMEGEDQEYAQTLPTFWLTAIPELPVPYHLIPAENGTYCTEPRSFVEEGLGQLTPCYTIEKP